MAAAVATSHGGSCVNSRKNDAGVDVERFKGTSLIAATRNKPRVQKEPVKNVPQPSKPEKPPVLKPAPDINVTGATIISSMSSIPNNELSKWAGMPLVSVTASIWAAKNAAKKQKNTQPLPPPSAKGPLSVGKNVHQHYSTSEAPALVPSQRAEHHDLNQHAPSPLNFRTPPPPVSPAPFSIHRFVQPPALQNVPHQYPRYPSHHPLSNTRSLDMNNVINNHPVQNHIPLRICHSNSEAFYMNFDHSSGSDEGSGVGSDGGLPRIIKPRKRRKKDKRNGDCVDSIESLEVDYNDNVWHVGYNHHLGQAMTNPWSESGFRPMWPGAYPSPPMTPTSANMDERRLSLSSSSISSSEEDVIASLMTLSRISTPPPSSSNSSSALSWTAPVTPPFDPSDYGMAKRDDWRHAQRAVSWNAPIMEVYNNPNFYDDQWKPSENGETPLQVSSEIIASPYGHRDIEIKFFSKPCF